MTNSVVAIIPARGGSKGIPKKNIVDLAGRPLISWTIDAALHSNCISDTYVTSDSDEILRISESLGAAPIERSESLSNDLALTVPVLQHALDYIESMGKRYDYLVLLQPTSPLRESFHIDEAFEKMLNAKASALISVVEAESSPLKSFIEQDGYLTGTVNNNYPFMRRQDLPVVYNANGAIYFVEMKAFKRNGSLMTDKCIPFIMDERSSIDIDSLTDLEAAEKYLIKK